MLESKDISVVLQGVINKNLLQKSLKNLKKYLPDAEIIISTWDNSDLTGLKELYNVLILNKDSGATVFDDEEIKPNNLNRILVSSRNGIAQATRKYVLRLRSDLILYNAKVLKLTDNLSVRNRASSLFKRKIFAYDIFSIKYDIKNNQKQRMLFHISDWIYFGLKDDIEELFNIPLVNEPEFSRYFETHKKLVDDLHETRLWKMSPEQYIVSQNAKKIFENLKYENYLDNKEENVKISEDFIINNFRVFSTKEWGISTLKKQYKNLKMLYRIPFSYYSAMEQRRDYKKYCDSAINISKIDFIQKLYNLEYYEALRKHTYQLIYCRLIKKPSELISVITYFFKFLFSLIKEVVCRKK